MKIIAKDNFVRETIADVLIAENVSEYYAKIIADLLQENYGGEVERYYYEAVPDEYKLWRGMEELI